MVCIKLFSMDSKILILQLLKRAIPEKEIKVNLIAKRGPKQQVRITRFKSKIVRILRD